MDGLWEYHNKGYLGVEVKYRGKSVPRGQSTALERLAVDIHDHYTKACDEDPERVKKAMIVCTRIEDDCLLNSMLLI